MPAFETTRRVRFTARQMYDLVADVERYPEFLPFCTGLKVQQRQPSADGEEITATMSVGFKAIRESFTTKVLLKPAAPMIDVAYLDGPFKRLDNRWEFRDVPGASDVIFRISYEFRSALLGIMVGAMFDQAFRRFAQAFEDRAGQVYRTAGPAT